MEQCYHFQLPNPPILALTAILFSTASPLGKFLQILEATQLVGTDQNTRRERGSLIPLSHIQHQPIDTASLRLLPDGAVIKLTATMTLTYLLTENTSVREYGSPSGSRRL